MHRTYQSAKSLFQTYRSEINRSLAVFFILLIGLSSGIAFYQLNFGKHLSVASAEADALLGLTNSYVSVYSKLRQQSDDAHLPVPAEFRALAAKTFNSNYRSESYLTARMVGVSDRYIETPPGDIETTTALMKMARSRSAESQSSLIKRDGALFLKNLYPSIAKEESCISCHNNIQSNTDTPWEIGDLMGAYIIERGVTAPHRRYMLFGILVGVLVSLLLWFALIALRQQRSLKTHASNLQTLANTDPLTGCMNRRALDEKFNNLDQATIANSMLLVLDIDHFKKINDTYGHDAGDEVLSWFSEQVRTQLRNNDIFARVGGEEFVIYVANISEEIAIKIADRICTHVATSEFSYSGTQIDVTVSIGAVHTGKVPEQPLSRYTPVADKSLYAAKSQGRNQVAWAN